MKRELKHLAPYLPYGVHLMNKYGNWHNTTLHKSISIYKMLEMKPILRPLSDFELVIAKDLMQKFNCSLDIIQEVWKLIQGDINLEDISLKTYLMMCENHIDFNRLIEAGLAIDINTLEK
jgi:hypothetical protein